MIKSADSAETAVDCFFENCLSDLSLVSLYKPMDMDSIVPLTQRLSKAELFILEYQSFVADSKQEWINLNQKENSPTSSGTAPVNMNLLVKFKVKITHEFKEAHTSAYQYVSDLRSLFCSYGDYQVRRSFKIGKADAEK
ncbi:MAG: hypothetical protein HQK52_17885 [Oligoflexia bacterium]|nr:hypothetical protein [Oligoflexia bacterium]